METWTKGVGLRPVGKPSDWPPDPNVVARHSSTPTAGRESRMQEPYRKGVAIHPDSESCAGGGNIAGEALTGAHTGQPLSSEISLSACRPRTCEGKAT